MFEFLKERKIKKQVDLIDFSKNYDTSIDENFQLDIKTNNPELTNIYIFSANSFEKRQSIYFKLKQTVSQTEIIVYYNEGFNKYLLEQQIYTTNCPLKINKEDDIWTIAFSGYLKKNNKDNAKFTFTAKFNSKYEIINDKSSVQKSNLIQAFKNDNNYNDVIKELENNEYTSYTQLGSIKGRMIVEGQSSNFEMTCIRKHIFGIYNELIYNNYMKIYLSDMTTMLNFNAVSSPKLTLIELGHYLEQNAYLEYIEKATYERQLITRGNAPTYINMLLSLYNKKNISLHIKKLDEIEIDYQDQNYLIISIVEILMEGKKYRGIIEYNFNHQEKKWFNGNDISDF